MKAIMIMFDSLNRHMLPSYGCEWTHAPNFQRLAERTVQFNNAYVGSMPCMPARRELHTGRYNFLHRSWGPLEPFDDSMPELLKQNGIYTHLATDHQHYFEDGGATYHQRYSSWNFQRGQEGDLWKGEVANPEIPETVTVRKIEAKDGKQINSMWRQDWINRKYMPTVESQPQHRTFSDGMEFIQTNHNEDNWFLQLETFDPHEPFFTHQKYKELYPHDYDGPHFDWPPYRPVQETPEEVAHMRYQYAALLSMCDDYLGKVLDQMDALNLWEDTMLIVCTDHGFLLGEHDWWAKIVMPFYNEVAHTPLFIWDPSSRRQDEQCDALAQMIDLPATLLEYFGIDLPPDMQGIPLGDAVASNAATREAVLYGVHGGHVNVTDGRYVYMRAPVAPDNTPLHEYTLMPTHMRNRFDPQELQDIQLAEPFSFTKGCRVMKVAGRSWINYHQYGTLLFDLQADPCQENPIQDQAIEARMIDHLVRLMKENDAPSEQFERMGLRVDS
ncbi:sulfatase [Chloroflexi bacterium TSY]|nr:sulfatase [Chloroflexi bacterium TSY]